MFNAQKKYFRFYITIECSFSVCVMPADNNWGTSINDGKILQEGEVKDFFVKEWQRGYQNNIIKNTCEIFKVWILKCDKWQQVQYWITYTWSRVGMSRTGLRERTTTSSRDTFSISALARQSVGHFLHFSWRHTFRHRITDSPLRRSTWTTTSRDLEESCRTRTREHFSRGIELFLQDQMWREGLKKVEQLKSRFIRSSNCNWRWKNKPLVKMAKTWTLKQYVNN